MARYSPAYSSLIRRLKEIQLILSMAHDFAKMRPIPPNPETVNALCRSGIVLLCSHVEGYIEELCVLAIGRIASKGLPKSSMPHAFKYYLSEDLIKNIQTRTDPELIASSVLKLLDRDTHIWDKEPNFASPLSADAFIRRFATPRHRNIKRILHRFGYKQFEYELSRHLSRDYMAAMNMVDNVVDQRNKISHGDFDTAGSPSDLHEMLKMTKLYCRGTDAVVGNWFRAIGCPIRSRLTTATSDR